jgi:hypothetical protein
LQGDAQQGSGQAQQKRQHNARGRPVHEVSEKSDKNRSDIATAGQQLKKTAPVFAAKALVSPYV